MNQQSADSTKKAANSIKFAMRVFSSAIFVLLLLLIAIVGRLLWIPPCTVVGQNSCAIDGWSIAGVAATMLGVGGTVLTLLGAVAVAAWWVYLDNRVKTQVEAQVHEKTEIVREQLTTEFKAHGEKLLEDLSASFQNESKALKDENALLKSQVDTLVTVTMRPDLQGIDRYLKDRWSSISYSDAITKKLIRNLVVRYIRIIRVFENDKSLKYLVSDGRMLTPVECLKEAQQWRDLLYQRHKAVNHDGAQISDQDLNEIYLATSYDVSKYEPFVDEWKKEHGY